MNNVRELQDIVNVIRKEYEGTIKEVFLMRNPNMMGLVIKMFLDNTSHISIVAPNPCTFEEFELLLVSGKDYSGIPIRCDSYSLLRVINKLIAEYKTEKEISKREIIKEDKISVINTKSKRKLDL